MFYDGPGPIHTHQISFFQFQIAVQFGVQGAILTSTIHPVGMHTRLLVHAITMQGPFGFLPHPFSLSFWPLMTAAV